MLLVGPLICAAGVHQLASDEVLVEQRSFRSSHSVASVGSLGKITRLNLQFCTSVACGCNVSSRC